MGSGLGIRDRVRVRVRARAKVRLRARARVRVRARARARVRVRALRVPRPLGGCEVVGQHGQGVVGAPLHLATHDGVGHLRLRNGKGMG